ncbi:SanA/YdcF family protein [Salinibius halmophilus]|uniref:SanA/YdcF family protein n=1 Tax=Salinibius halmophilus TaxID=1853216 RepID=UPI000E65EB99|nr:ElyC/SanA/YdcF family protein [Salinibius halmophilus]
MKTIALWGIRLTTVALLTVLFIDGWFEWRYQPAITSSGQPTPFTSDVALVLGTSKFLVGGGINQYYQNRINRAAELYQSGRVKILLVSGDNGTLAYNEPVQMQRDLMRLGVPESAIVLDYAGFRTLDSVQRAHKVFGLDHMLVVSQPFHLPRALFLAEQVGMQAQGVAAAEPHWWWNARVRLREVLARNVAILDTLMGRQAKFVGPAEPIELP